MGGGGKSKNVAEATAVLVRADFLPGGGGGGATTFPLVEVEAFWGGGAKGATFFAASAFARALFRLGILSYLQMICITDSVRHYQSA